MREKRRSSLSSLQSRRDSLAIDEPHTMDEADRKLLQKIISLPEDKPQKLCDAMGS